MVFVTITILVTMTDIVTEIARGITKDLLKENRGATVNKEQELKRIEKRIDALANQANAINEEIDSLYERLAELQDVEQFEDDGEED